MGSRTRWMSGSVRAVALATAGLGAVASPARADSQTFTTSSASSVFTVPAATCSLRIDASGASGGSGGGASPGAGGEVLATIAAQPGQQLKFVFGHQGGANSGGFRGGEGAGFATGGPGGSGSGQGGGGGGGSTAVTLNGIPVVIAGGGGGGAYKNHAGGTGGNGTTTIVGTAASGGDGTQKTDPESGPAGKGGRANGMGGAGGDFDIYPFPGHPGGNAPNGSGGAGSSTSFSYGGGGGGGGYSGGGGGAGDVGSGTEAGSGGGGSSWANPAFAPTNVQFPTAARPLGDGDVTLTFGTDPTCGPGLGTTPTTTPHEPVAPAAATLSATPRFTG